MKANPNYTAEMGIRKLPNLLVNALRDLCGVLGPSGRIA